MEYLDVSTIPSSGSTSARFGPWVVPISSGGTMEGRKHPDPFAGEILVLTDHSTFSSAADFAVVLSDNDLAQVVGAPPGSAPTGAGDVVIFELPHSGLFMQVSYKQFQRPDPTLPAHVLELDIPADPTGSVEEMITLAQQWRGVPAMTRRPASHGETQHRADEADGNHRCPLRLARLNGDDHC